MTKEKLFELATSLVAANIAAGQFIDGMNFVTVVHDYMETACDQMEAAWKAFSGDDEVTFDVPEGSIHH